MNNFTKTWMTASCLVLSVVPVLAQTVSQKPTNGTALPVAIMSARPVSDARRTIAVEPGAVTRVVVVSLEDRRLALVEDGVVKKVYRVAVGKESTPSPTGTFMVMDRVENPTYYHAGQVVPPGPANPVGTRWIGLNKKGYGIHGTNAPRSIGKAASHGCIRMCQRDLEDLFAQLRSGDSVEIIGERNEETAAIFGTPNMPGLAPAVQTVLAQAAPEAPAQNPVDAAATALIPAVVPVSQ